MRVTSPTGNALAGNTSGRHYSPYGAEMMGRDWDTDAIACEAAGSTWEVGGR